MSFLHWYEGKSEEIYMTAKPPSTPSHLRILLLYNSIQLWLQLLKKMSTCKIASMISLIRASK